MGKVLFKEDIQVAFTGQTIFKISEKFLTVPKEDLMVALNGDLLPAEKLEIKNGMLYWDSPLGASGNLIVAAWFDEEEVEPKGKSRK